MKNTIKKGADANVIIEILMSDDVKSLSKIDRENMVIKKYNEYFGKTSKETIKANIREDIIVKNQKNRFLTKLPQDLKKLDIMAAHIDTQKDIVVITFSQQKGNNASFNSSSEAKTLENMSKCVNDKTYVEFFELLPENLNPNKNGKKFEIDLVVGMVNARGKNIKNKDGVDINYLTGDDYLLYLGLDINVVELAFQIQRENRIQYHSYDAISECCNWGEIYNECLRILNYD